MKIKEIMDKSVEELEGELENTARVRFVRRSIALPILNSWTLLSLRRISLSLTRRDY